MPLRRRGEATGEHFAKLCTAVHGAWFNITRNTASVTQATQDGTHGAEFCRLPHQASFFSLALYGRGTMEPRAACDWRTEALEAPRGHGAAPRGTAPTALTQEEWTTHNPHAACRVRRSSSPRVDLPAVPTLTSQGTGSPRSLPRSVCPRTSRCSPFFHRSGMARWPLWCGAWLRPRTDAWTAAAASWIRDRRTVCGQFI